MFLQGCSQKNMVTGTESWPLQQQCFYLSHCKHFRRNPELVVARQVLSAALSHSARMAEVRCSTGDRTNSSDAPFAVGVFDVEPQDVVGDGVLIKASINSIRVWLILVVPPAAHQAQHSTARGQHDTIISTLLTPCSCPHAPCESCNAMQCDTLIEPPTDGPSC